MKIYISGISGTGMGPLALMANDAGYEVCGSDLARGAVYDELIDAGIKVAIGEQDGKFLQENLEDLDWYVYTSALPEDHAELKIAREAGVKCTKRDEFTAYLVEELDLKMVAVAGTHGKTTTTAMIVWLTEAMGLPVSYVVGTTLGFAPSGAYHEGDEYFVYEADEYDRNFLKFHPWLAAITCISYDHPDIYKKKRDYRAAFLQFKAQSETVLDFAEDADGNHTEYFDMIAGEARRKDARLAFGVIALICRDLMEMGELPGIPDFERIIEEMNEFPGVGRRFEMIGDGVYTDYAHHPEEIAATIEIAEEEADIFDLQGVVVVYQPHQNTRQHEVREEYKDAFAGAEKVFWLPTYLTREDSDLPVLTPEELIEGMDNAEAAEMNDELVEKVKKYLDDGYLAILMTAGPADEWWREKFGDPRFLLD